MTWPHLLQRNITKWINRHIPLHIHSAALLAHTGIWCSFLRVRARGQSQGGEGKTEKRSWGREVARGGKGAVSWFCMAALESHWGKARLRNTLTFTHMHTGLYKRHTNMHRDVEQKYFQPRWACQLWVSTGEWQELWLNTACEWTDPRHAQQPPGQDSHASTYRETWHTSGPFDMLTWKLSINSVSLRTNHFLPKC